MLRVLIFNNGEIFDTEVFENFEIFDKIFGAYINDDFESSDNSEIKLDEFYPWDNKKIAAIMLTEGTDFTEVWKQKDTENFFYGPVIFVHSDPVEPNYENLSDTECEWLSSNIQLISKSLLE